MDSKAAIDQISDKVKEGEEDKSILLDKIEQLCFLFIFYFYKERYKV